MTPNAFNALRAIINFGRMYPKRKAQACREHVLHIGFTKEEVDEAIKFWHEYETEKDARNGPER